MKLAAVRIKMAQSQCTVSGYGVVKNVNVKEVERISFSLNGSDESLNFLKFQKRNISTSDFIFNISIYKDLSI